MKKIIYIVTLLVVTSLSITSCTKEEVAPSNKDVNATRDIKE
jgi:hypothetical protein